MISVRVIINIVCVYRVEMELVRRWEDGRLEGQHFLALNKNNNIIVCTCTPQESNMCMVWMTGILGAGWLEAVHVCVD